jgi:hypothetical protein
MRGEWLMSMRVKSNWTATASLPYLAFIRTGLRLCSPIYLGNRPTVSNLFSAFTMADHCISPSALVKGSGNLGVKGEHFYRGLG